MWQIEQVQKGENKLSNLSVVLSRSLRRVALTCCDSGGTLKYKSLSKSNIDQT